MPKTTWTDSDFAELSWHDNHIHGLRMVEGEYGAGELVLDIDFILDWLPPQNDVYQFRIAPADLTFHDVINLKVELDYATISAAMGAFSIDGIKRRSERRERYAAQLWTIDVNFPDGQLSFEASGFTQVLRGNTVTVDRQVLRADERKTARRTQR